jgi:hypothetical protein
MTYGLSASYIATVNGQKLTFTVGTDLEVAEAGVQVSTTYVLSLLFASLFTAVSNGIA